MSIMLLPRRDCVDLCFRGTARDSLSGGGGSDAREPGVVMETKLKALVAKLSAIHVKVRNPQGFRTVRRLF